MRGMADQTPTETTTDTAAQIAAAERRGVFKGQVLATRGVVAFFAAMVRQTFGPEAIDAMLVENKRTHAEAEARGEPVGVWDEARERDDLQDRAAIVAAFLGNVVEAVAKGAHLDAPDRRTVRDKGGDEWVVSGKF